MTTDTALGVTKIVVEDKGDMSRNLPVPGGTYISVAPLDEIPYTVSILRVTSSPAP